MTTLSNETVPTSEQEQSLSESACTERQMGRSLEQAQEEGVSCSSNSEEPNAVHYAPHELGRKGEAAAARFLKNQSYEILEQNWTCFAGEADIIARIENTLCFIEVKTRSQLQKGFPEEAVDARKRDRYERIAACYLKDSALCDIRVRFDVISILVLSEHRAFLRFHTNAFGVE